MGSFWSARFLHSELHDRGEPFSATVFVRGSGSLGENKDIQYGYLETIEQFVSTVRQRVYILALTTSRHRRTTSARARN